MLDSFEHFLVCLPFVDITKALMKMKNLRSYLTKPDLLHLLQSKVDVKRPDVQLTLKKCRVQSTTSVKNQPANSDALYTPKK